MTSTTSGSLGRFHGILPPYMVPLAADGIVDRIDAVLAELGLPSGGKPS